MRLSSLLYICLAAATFAAFTSTAESWYNSAALAFHSRMEDLDAQFKKLKAVYHDYSNSMLGKVKSGLKRKELVKPIASMKSFLERMRTYVLGGRKVVEEEELLKAKQKRQLEEKKEL